MSLTKLPSEITRKICEFGMQDGNYMWTGPTQDLCALALTCRSLSGVATDLLYSHLNLVLLSSVRETTRWEKFVRSIHDNPPLVNRIHSCHFTVDIYQIECRTICNQLLSHLARSTSLHSTVFRFTEEWPVMEERWPTEQSLSSHVSVFCNLMSEGFPHLRELQITVNYGVYGPPLLSADSLMKLCEHSHLETLHIGSTIMGFVNDIPLTNTLSTKRFPQLKHVDFLQSCNYLSTAALEGIITCASNLSSLKLTIPAPSTPAFSQHSELHPYFEFAEPLRPGFYGQLLSPLAATLTELWLDGSDMTIPGHDGSRIDLSHFTNLRKLVISSCYLFGVDHTIAANCPESLDVWKSLPPRLYELSVVFQGCQGLFWSVDEMMCPETAIRFDKLWERRQDEYPVGWLLRLLERKVKHENSLQEIKIEEQIFNKIDNYRRSRPGRWCKTDRLNSMADAAGTDVSIFLRIPDHLCRLESEAFDRPS